MFRKKLNYKIKINKTRHQKKKNDIFFAMIKNNGSKFAKEAEEYIISNC